MRIFAKTPPITFALAPGKNRKTTLFVRDPGPRAGGFTDVARHSWIFPVLLTGSLLADSSEGRLSEKPDLRTILDESVKTHIRLQEKDGSWPYEGAYRVQGEIPIGYRIGGTALAASALLAAAPDDKDATPALEAARDGSGAFAYGGAWAKGPQNLVPGSIARSPICEATLLLLDGGSQEALQKSLDDFHAHWEELEKRRKRTGTHEGPYRIAPYYFYFAHRSVAGAIDLLPEERRAPERERLIEKLLKTRDPDGTWNDRIYPRSRNFGTAMAILALCSPGLPPPLR